MAKIRESLCFIPKKGSNVTLTHSPQKPAFKRIVLIVLIKLCCRHIRNYNLLPLAMLIGSFCRIFYCYLNF